jgi:hypothetical protein
VQLDAVYSGCVAFFCAELVLRAQSFGLGLCTCGRRAKHHHRDGALVPPPLLHTVRFGASGLESRAHNM